VREPNRRYTDSDGGQIVINSWAEGHCKDGVNFENAAECGRDAEVGEYTVEVFAGLLAMHH
jgi:hypothetical protein